MRICIVVPTYNERENIQKLIPEIETVLSDHHLEGNVMVVDDNSPDGTGEVAEQLAKVYGNVLVIDRPAKLGIGSAYRKAFQWILESLDVDVVFEMDADFSHDPAYIPSLIKKLSEGYDAVVGSRYIDGGSINNWPVTRQTISKVANFLAQKLTGIKISDMTSGFRAYRVGALRSIDINEVKSDGYAFQVEILHRCMEAGLKIAEHPIIFKERNDGESKLGKRAVLEFLRTLVDITFYRIITR